MLACLPLRLRPAIAPAAAPSTPSLSRPRSPLVFPTQAEHKIQSAGGPLTLSLERVPKALGTLRALWCPAAMVVSFKLETDERVLLRKARSWVLVGAGWVAGML